MRISRSSLSVLAFFTLLAGAAVGGYGVGAARTVRDTRAFSCSMHPSLRQEGPGPCPVCQMELVPVDRLIADEGPAITIDPVMVQNMGVRVQPVVRGELLQELRLCGTLQVAPDHVRDITLKFSGFVEHLHASRDGMAIAAGAPLFELYAPDLVVAEERLLAATRGTETATLAAARQRLQRWDVPEAVIDGVLRDGRAPRTIVWPSPVTGLVVQRNLTLGGRVEAGTSVLRVADLSLLWIEAQIPESQLAAVHPGMIAAVELQAQPGGERRCTVTAIAPAVDEHTRTGSAWLELPNADGTLKPGMYALVRLHAVQQADAMLMPDAAVLDTGTRQFAWVALGHGRFEPRALQLGPTGEGGVVQVQAGLAAGELVVVSGQLLIDAESRLREGTAKFTAQGLLRPATER